MKDMKGNKRILYVFVFFIIVLLFTGSNTIAGVIYNGASDSILNRLIKIEDKVYGKTYNNDGFKERIRRIEKSFYGKCNVGTLMKRLKCVEEDIKANDKIIERKRQFVFLEFVEKRYYNQVFAVDPFEKRISRLEQIVFGDVQDGDINNRYEQLMKKVPIVLPMSL